jgi:beta-galactosidase
MDGERMLALGEPRLWHGGDYNPDQWDEATRADDVRLMKLSHMNIMTVGVFAWSQMEPKEGQYDWGWLDDTFERLHAAGIRVALATPSAAPPRWLTTAHPEALMVQPDRRRRPHGSRVNYCPTSPLYREHVARINGALAERYGRHPAMRLWHVSNEYGGIQCMCDLCAEGFREWLRRRYGDLDTMNCQYWSAFWSHRFGDWAEVIPPYADCGVVPNALTLDWKRYTSWRVADFFRREVEVLREVTPSIPVTTNLMGTYGGLDYAGLADVMDVISWDSYPDVGGDPVHPAFRHALMRGLKANRPWILMESTPSSTNWKEFPTLKPPGLHRLWAWQAIAHGSDASMYFQWRRSRGAHEKFHGAAVEHAGTERARVFREVADLGAEMETLAPDLAGSRVHPARAGVVYDMQCRWALEGSCGPGRDKKWVETVQRFYRALWRRNVPVDVVRMDADWSQYDLIVAPMLYMVKSGAFPRSGDAEETRGRQDEAARIEEFVRRGGTFVTTYLSGIVNENDLVYEGGYPGPLRELLGVWIEETDVVEPGKSPNMMIMETHDLEGMKASYRCDRYLDLLEPEGARVLATYGKGWYAGRPALTVNRVGDGRAYHLACDCEDACLEDLLSALAREKGIEPLVPWAEEADGVEVLERRADGRRFLFLLNHANEERVVDLGAVRCRDLLDGRALEGRVTLEPLDARIAEAAPA